MRSFGPPLDTLAKQHQASDPSQSAWVSANAGSGKTHVLASRVIRLLMRGVQPAKILCLTFTKAAAANMAARIFDTLARWTQLSNDDLSRAIVEIGSPNPGNAELTVARKLFGRALETPGGLKIQTIHAFCERLLHSFPFEANVPSRFEVAGELIQAELLQRARNHVLAEANSGKGRLAANAQRIAEECGAEAFEDLIKEAMENTVGSILRTRQPQVLTEALRRSLGLAKERDSGAIEREIAEFGLSPKRWSEIAEQLEKGTADDKDQAKRLRQTLDHYRSLPSGGSFDAFLDAYSSIFFTTDKKGERKGRERLITNGLAKANPEILNDLCNEQQRLARLCGERKAAATLDRSRALIEIATAIFERYAAEKAARGILDFDDLIEKSLGLLDRSDASWVLFKLDAGIDHILVDEAQDTSERQWRILESLSSEFASGAGQVAHARTFFAVGDEKQSIFSFQGAEPKMFDAMRRKFERRSMAARQRFEDVRLTFSFRSGPGVLSAIDTIFEHGNHREGLVAPGEIWMPHQALKQLPALIELWPLIPPPEADDPREWALPLDLPGEQDPANIVAGRVAQKIAHLIDPGSQEFVRDSQTLRPRPVRPGDILILVRKRGPFFEAMIRALKKKKIPTAGADRLDLTGHIAIMDLVAAGRASLLPDDDLTLASVLKSPLIGLNDDDLLALAPCRKASLFDALRASAEARHIEAAAKLDRWRARKGGGPFAFYASLLGADGGRREIEARLGAEACDAIDEFLRLALAHEETNAPSLAAFLNDIEGLDYSVKRDMESAENAVRVMTVHAAKGLEAKIIFIPDTCRVPSANHDPQIFVLDTKIPGEKTIAWSPKKDCDCDPVADARKKARGAAMEEYRRLLYVALSRAEERLYIAGFHGARKPDGGCWAKMIEAALANDPHIRTVPAFWDAQESILRRVSAGSGAPAGLDLAMGQIRAGPPSLPEWLFRPPPAEAQARSRISPSKLLALPERQKREALRRGRLIHSLLQYLPGVAPAGRRGAALAFLSARADPLDQDAREKLAQEALDIIGLPELSALFGPGSKAEVPVAGRVGAGPQSLSVAGRVDRLAVAEAEVLVADYKTGSPCALEDTPAGLIAQLALYRAVLAPLWPDKTLRMLLIWTQGARVVWIPAERLDAALAALTIV